VTIAPIFSTRFDQIAERKKERDIAMTEQQNEQPQDQPEKKQRARKARGRSRGEGSVFKRSGERNKPWVAQITKDGKPKIIGYFKTEAEALTARNKALRDLEQGAWVESSKQTLAEYLDYWLEHVHKPAIGSTTYAGYRYTLNSRIIPALGHIQVQKLTMRQVQMFYSDLLTNERLSGARVRNIHRLLRMALEHAVHEGLVTKNICQEVKLPRSEKRERTVLALEEATQLWSSVEESNMMRMVMMLAVTTTLRRGEVLALHWQDVNLKERKIQIRRSLAYLKERGLFEKEPKSAHSKREIALPSFVANALEKYRVSQQIARQAAGDAWQDHDLVFCNSKGAHIPLNALNRQLARILSDAGLPKMRFHDLRHSAVTILLKMGVPPHVVQEIAGHSDIRITLGVYGHVLPGQQGDAMQKWDDALGDS
jgi:integrase